ncbi:MAG TPA: TetR/AcrR family transcriptional regulator [Pseudolysinimonas sp.]|nr:TetR/AcrR family transcriptional regulator [Pseudolysinimonas sp.]
MTQVLDGRRVRGDATRRAILRRAVDEASLSGLDGLTIGGLASALGISKSNVATLFGSKLDLQLATIEAAREIFIDAVIVPGLAAPHGLPRLWAIVDAWLTYSESRTFAGGCFFRAVAADASAKDDAARELLVQIDVEWAEFLTRAVREAGLPDPEGLAFEITALLDAANLMSQLHRSPRGYAQARASIRARLDAVDNSR